MADRASSRVEKRGMMRAARFRREAGWLLRDKYGGRASPEFFADCVRVKKGEPMDYVIGWTPFLGVRLDLSSRPFIPRPETEYWTKRAIGAMRARKLVRSGRGARVLDFFAGSGAIGIAVLAGVPHTHVTFGEIDHGARKQIKKNISLNQISRARVRVVKTDVWKGITGTFDLILANPPYATVKNTERAVLRNEPRGAILGGGRDGLSLIEKFFALARSHLNRDGELWMEFHSPQKDAIARYARSAGFCVAFHKDQYHRWRYLTARGSP